MAGRIAANKAKDHLQSAWNRHAVLPGDEEMPPGPGPACRGGGPPAQRGGGHPGRHRGAAESPTARCARLCLLEEKSPEEAALALGRPVKTIHTQLSRGKRLLREKLERSEGHGAV